MGVEALVQSAEQRLLWSQRVVAAALLAGIGLSPRLWTDQRVFPLIPAWPFIPPAPSWVQIVLLLTLLTSTLLLLVAPKVRAHGVAVLAAAALVALDLNRLQPWFYEYVLLILVFGLFRRQPNRAETAWRLAALIVAAIYFWSGLHKLSTGFETYVFPNLIRRFAPYIGDGKEGPAAWLRIAAPWVEASIGAALLVPRLRRWGVAGVLGMHLLILVAIGPLGNNDNTVVWPWNLASSALCVVLFLGNPTAVFPDLLSRSGWVGPLLFTLCGLMPALHLVDLWDTFLSASLYSGRRWDAAVRLTPAAAQAMPKEVMAYSMKVQDGYTLHLPAWCMSELNVPLYPEPRAFRAVARELVARAGHPAGVRLLAETPPGWRSTERTVVELELEP